MAANERYFVGDTVRIIHVPRQPISGLSDVKIDIYDANDVKVVNQGVMTEINTTGVYRFDFTLATKGKHVAISNAPSQSKTIFTEFLAEDRTSFNTRTLRREIASPARVVIRDTWSEEDKLKVQKGIKDLLEAHDIAVGNLMDRIKRVEDVDKKITTLNDDIVRVESEISVVKDLVATKNVEAADNLSHINDKIASVKRQIDALDDFAKSDELKDIVTKIEAIADTQDVTWELLLENAPSAVVEKFIKKKKRKTKY